MLQNVWMNWWTWYRLELVCSSSERFFKDRRILICCASELTFVPAASTASAASESNEPGNTEKIARALCSSGFSKLNEVWIAFFRDISSLSMTSKKSLSRLATNLASLYSESRQPTIHSARGTRAHNSTSFFVWVSVLRFSSLDTFEKRSLSASSWLKQFILTSFFV